MEGTMEVLLFIREDKMFIISILFYTVQHFVTYLDTQKTVTNFSKNFPALKIRILQKNS